MLDKLTQNLLEMPGVEGLCFISASSELLYRRMPAYIPDFVFDTALRRVTALYETIDGNYQKADDYVLKFRGYGLVLRRVDDVILLLLVTEAANLMSLRMVTNMLFRNLQNTPALLAELKGARALGSTPAEAVAGGADLAGGVRKHRRVYRGLVIDE